MKMQYFTSKKAIAIIALLALVVSCTDTSKETKKIIAIGDSNGAFDYGWVAQLQKLLPNDVIYNTSISGNTIGFDNLGQTKLNTLKNLDAYLAKAKDSLIMVDYVVIMLGTNDSKYVFRDRQDEVLANMNTLVARIKSFFESDKEPKIIIVAPPPYGDDSILAEKYKGGNERVEMLEGKYKKLAEKNQCEFVDAYHVLKDTFMQYSKDGVHLNEEGQKIIAQNISKAIK